MEAAALVHDRLCVLLVPSLVVGLAPLGHLGAPVVLTHLASHDLSPLDGVCDLGLEEACAGLEVALVGEVGDQVVEVALVEGQVGVAELEDLALEVDASVQEERGVFVLPGE